MTKFHQLDNFQKHTYDIEKCSSCECDIAELDEYNEILLTSQDEKSVHHIALCNDCYLEAKNHIDL